MVKKVVGRLYFTILIFHSNMVKGEYDIYGSTLPLPLPYQLLNKHAISEKERERRESMKELPVKELSMEPQNSQKHGF